MSNIQFRSAEHRDFFLENMSKCRVNDCYHRAFFYVMGIASETRANISQMFDFKNDCIEPDGMHGGWQTSGTVMGTPTWTVPSLLHRKICSVVNLPPTSWRASRSGIPNIAGIFPHPENKTNGHAKKGEAHEKV